jgi:hypothetical protein
MIFVFLITVSILKFIYYLIRYYGTDLMFLLVNEFDRSNNQESSNTCDNFEGNFSFII